MTDSSPASERLQALIGDAIHDLSPHFVRKLDRLLADQDDKEATSDRVVNLFGDRHRAQGHPRSEATWARANGQDQAASISRKFAGLSAIMQILEAAHHCREEDTNEPVLGVHLVEGLLMAGRELFDAVDDGLSGAG